MFKYHQLSILCIQSQCFWIDFQCLTLKSCKLLKGASQSECIVQSINCSASDGTNCQEKQQLYSCQSYLKKNQCQYVLGSNGFCYWQSNSCQVLSKCTSIQTQRDCQYLKKQCYWVYDSCCQPASCSQFQTVETCQFDYTSINSYSTVPCQWNSTTGVCLQPTNYMTQLNSNNCQTNTNKGARWSYTLNFCLSCQISKPPNPKQCGCSQLVTQLNSVQSLQCLWNNQTNSCQQLPCANLQQSLCIQNSQCMQTGSFLRLLLQMNVPLSLFIVLTTILLKNSAKQLPYQFLKIAMGYLYKIVTFLYHHITIAIGIMNQTNVRFKGKPIIVKIIVNTIAKAFPIAIIKMDVKKKQCQHYQTKESCTFSFKPQNWNYIQSCSRLNGAYVPADNLFSEQTCFTNTDQTARWSSNIKDGNCIPCNLPLYQVIIPKNQCLCSQLLTYQECDQASCYWEGSVCTDLNFFFINLILNAVNLLPFQVSVSNYTAHPFKLKKFMCVWNGLSNTCSSASYLIYQTFQNCYSNTGGTYHWSISNNKQLLCFMFIKYDKAKEYLFIYVIEPN